MSIGGVLWLLSRMRCFHNPRSSTLATKRRQTEGWFAYCIDNIWHWAASESSLARMLGREYRLVRNDRLVVPEFRDLIPEEED